MQSPCVLKQAVGSDWKGKASPFFYLAAMGAAFWVNWLAQLIYVAAALIWLVPDRRIERALHDSKGELDHSA